MKPAKAQDLKRKVCGLKLTIKTGFLISFFSILYTIYNLIAYKLGIIKISGFTSLIISVWILSGLIIFTLGITGLYISRIFEGIKSRPIYIIESTTKDATS